MREGRRARKVMGGLSPGGIADLDVFFFFQAEDGIRDYKVTGVQTCALPIYGEPMETKITKSARAELVRALHDRYKSANRAEKMRMLNEFGALSGYHRKYALRVLNGAVEPREPAQSPARPRLYGEATRQVLIVLWEASDRVRGKRLKPLLAVLLPAMERHGHMNLDPAIRSKMLGMSAATIDRLLRDTKSVTRADRPRRNMLGLRRIVPVRTFADWKG